MKRPCNRHDPPPACLSDPSCWLAGCAGVEVDPPQVLDDGSSPDDGSSTGGNEEGLESYDPSEPEEVNDVALTEEEEPDAPEDEGDSSPPDDVEGGGDQPLPTDGPDGAANTFGIWYKTPTPVRSQARGPSPLSPRSPSSPHNRNRGRCSAAAVPDPPWPGTVRRGQRPHALALPLRDALLPLRFQVGREGGGRHAPTRPSPADLLLPVIV